MHDCFILRHKQPISHLILECREIHTSLLLSILPFWGAVQHPSVRIGYLRRSIGDSHCGCWFAVTSIYVEQCALPNGGKLGDYELNLIVVFSSGSVPLSKMSVSPSPDRPASRCTGLSEHRCNRRGAHLTARVAALCFDALAPRQNNESLHRKLFHQ